MIVRDKERVQKDVFALKGGTGLISKYDYLLNELPGNAQMISELVLSPGASIGEHQHLNEYEIMFFCEGELTLKDDGKNYLMNPGDFAICFPGHSHALKNHSKKAGRIKACIIRCNE